MNYYDVRHKASQKIPRMLQFIPISEERSAVREKGRKSNYHQFSLSDLKWEKNERLLNTEEVNSFLEISIRAQACPMPLNLDVWDGLKCVVEGEKVFTSTGEIPIERVQVGNKVLSYNEDSKQLEYQEVTHTSTSIRQSLVEIETEVGLLRVTEDHPIYTQRGWIEAGSITEEDLIFTIGAD